VHIYEAISIVASFFHKAAVAVLGLPVWRVWGSGVAMILGRGPRIRTTKGLQPPNINF